MNRKTREWTLKLSAFFASNFLGTVVDTVVLFVFSTYVFPEARGASQVGANFGHVIVSPFISFECAVLVNFICSYFVIWRNRISHFSKGSFFGHYLAYNLSCSAVFLFKMLILYLIWYFSDGWNVVICNLLALCVSGGVNFLLGEKVIFRKKKILSTDIKTDAGTE